MSYHLGLDKILSIERLSLQPSAITFTSSSNPFESVIGSKPRLLKPLLATSKSLLASSLRGLSYNRTSTLYNLEIISANSNTDLTSETWLNILTFDESKLWFNAASSIHLAVSLMWINALDWPPVPYTVSGWPTAAWHKNLFKTVP